MNPRRTITGVAVLAAILSATGAAGQRAHAAARPAPTTPIRVTWLGHAGFELVSAGGTRLLVDPWIEGNAAAPAAYRDSARYAAAATRPSAIVVTHGHEDHDGDVPRLARWSGAPVVATGGHLEALH